MKNLIKVFLIVTVLTGAVNFCYAQKNIEKPRVIAMTDGEIDDRSSMVRFLLYTCDIELLAIIETNSIYQRSGHSKESWFEDQLNAYEHIYPNLIVHNPDYPTVDQLRSVSFIGDENEDHLRDLKRRPKDPGDEVLYRPDNWSDTPGSDIIVEILLEEDPRPVHIQAWGGGNTAARAFYKLKTEYPAEYDRAVSKVVMYNIWYQDGAGNYIETYHPKITMIYCGSFAGTWNYKSQTKTYDFIENEVKNNHGPLGGLYPQDYVSEGDSPAFLYSIANGLRNNENPTYGGWGGRFTKVKGLVNVYKDALDDGDNRKSLRRWIDDANRNFQARMDWCVSSKYEEANHQPVAYVKGKKDITVKSGKKVKLDAGKSSDPDGDDIVFSWWQYKDAGSYEGLVKFNKPENARSGFVAPNVSEPETLHIILKVTDNGSPSLDSYQRLIITIVP